MNQNQQPVDILITGVYGLIGNLVYAHLAGQPEKYTVFGLDRIDQHSERMNPGKVQRVPEENFLLADLNDMNSLEKAVRGKQVVIHLAADPGSRNWASLLPNNVIGTYHLFEACRKANVRRVIFASTIVVHFGYGAEEPYRSIMNGNYENIPVDFHKISHIQPPRPSSLYAATKLWGEALAFDYAFEYDISCLCLRIGWVVSENLPPPKHGRSVWCSHRDICQLVQRCIEAPEHIKFDVFYGFSNNDYTLASLEHTCDVLGYQPLDRAESALEL